MSFDKAVVKAEFIRDKGFLKSLYEANLSNISQILKVADDVQLNSLIKYLHFLSNGEIKIKKANFEILRKHKKLKLLRSKFETQNSASHLMQQRRQFKAKTLANFGPFLPTLLESLFRE